MEDKEKADDKVLVRRSAISICRADISKLESLLEQAWELADCSVTEDPGYSHLVSELTARVRVLQSSVITLTTS